MECCRQNMLILMFVFICIQATIMVVLWTFNLTGPWPAPVDLDSRYFRLANYTLTNGYYHIEQQNLLSPQAICRILCDRHDGCLAYTVSDYPPGRGKNKGRCHFFKGSPTELGLRPEPEQEHGTEFFVKNNKTDELLQEDQNAYYAMTSLTNYTEAVKACNQSFYHLAMALPGNQALNMVKMNFKSLLFYSHNSTRGTGFFVDVFEKVHVNARDSDLSGSKTYIKLRDDPAQIYTKRIVYYNGKENVINSTSSKLGYPLCQGTPFNLLEESEFLQAKPYTTAAHEVADYSNAVDGIERPLPQEQLR